MSSGTPRVHIAATYKHFVTVAVTPDSPDTTVVGLNFLEQLGIPVKSLTDIHDGLTLSSTPMFWLSASGNYF